MRSEKIVSPMLSCGATSLRNACRPALAFPRRFSCVIEPEVSSTSSTFAGLRSLRHAFFRAARTRGSGSPSTRSGCLGSTPLAAVSGGCGSAFRSDGRKPYFAAFAPSMLSARYVPKLAAPAACGAVTHGAFSVMYGLSEKNVPSDG